MDNLGAWLRKAGLSRYRSAFRAERLAPDHLRGLSDAELRELGLSIGDRIRFRRAVTALDPASQLTPAVAERRPLTVAFVDLVDSTALSARLDPEDLLETMRRYHEACIDPIMRYGGQVRQFLGDGILAYFCFPVAHEDDPERAVRAALEAVAAVGRLQAPDGTPLAAHAGIATGRVVVGDLFYEPPVATGAGPGQALGSTPNLAARLQGLALPGEVIVAAETAARLRGHFSLDNLGPRPLRGFIAPIDVFRVGPELPSRAHRPPGTPRVAAFVGREEEMALLHARWAETVEGRGGAVLLRGEAGIGKSRLARRFLVTRAARSASATLSIYASPYHGDDPLWPVAVALRRLTRSGSANTADALHRLRRVLVLDTTDTEQDTRLAALAELLGLGGDREAAHLRDASPSLLKALTLDTLVEGVARTAKVRPLLLLVEDGHWLDPTTLELVERVVAGASAHRVLVLLTAREEFSVPAGETWATLATMELRGLKEAEATRLFEEVCGGAGSPQLGRELAIRTEGVPLFVEEFARAVAKSGEYEALSIPATLHECLAARLDRAGSAKAVAQAAAVLGQERVSAVELAIVAGLPEPAVREALVRLEAAGVLERSHGLADEGWSFRHALLREAAYDGLLRDRRKLLHSRAADAMAAEAEPAILAHHFSEAGRAAESVPHFLNAARRSLARSALREAIRLLRRGLTALESQTVSPDLLEQRLELMALLGPALIGLNGPGSPETQALYTEAVALARSLPPREEHFPIFWGWWRLSHMHDFNESRARAAWLYAEARKRADRGLLLQAHHCNWATLHYQGDLKGSAQHIRQGLSIYRQEEHGSHASLYGNHDAKVCAHAHHALGLWQRGLTHAAAVEEAHSLAWAEHLGHVGSTLHALEVAMVHRAYRHNPEEVRAAADRLRAFAEEHGYSHYRNRCRIFHGWAMAMSEDAATGAKLAAEGLAIEREVNTADDFAVFQCLVAEARSAAGEPDRALAELIEACTEFERIGLYHWMPEVWRLIGDLMLQVNPKAIVKAARAYAKARRLADQQGAHRLALRAALGTARLALSKGWRSAAPRLAAARERVMDVESEATDLRDAEALTSLLRQPRAPSAVSGRIVARKVG